MVIWLNWIGDPISPLPKMAQKAQGISGKKEITASAQNYKTSDLQKKRKISKTEKLLATSADEKLYCLQFE